MFKIARYSIYLDSNLEKKFENYMKENQLTNKSSSIKGCINKVISSSDYENQIYEINQKLNRILYRLNLNKKILEQFFANFGFEVNYEVDKDLMLKQVYDRNNSKYSGRFD